MKKLTTQISNSAESVKPMPDMMESFEKLPDTAFQKKVFDWVTKNNISSPDQVRDDVWALCLDAGSISFEDTEAYVRYAVDVFFNKQAEARTNKQNPLKADR